MEIDAIHTVVAMHSSRNMPLHPPLSILPPLSSSSAAQPPVLVPNAKDTFRQGKFATAANPLGFHVLAWTVPLEATPQPLPAKARTPNHFAQGRCRANTPVFGAGWWI